MNNTFNYKSLSSETIEYLYDTADIEEGTRAQFYFPKIISTLRKKEQMFLNEVHDKELANPGEIFYIEF